MAKKLFAVTNIKAEEFYEANTEVDASKFTPEQLKELYDNGAVEVRTVDDEPEPEPEKPAEAPKTETVKPGPDTTVKAPEKK